MRIPAPDMGNTVLSYSRLATLSAGLLLSFSHTAAQADVIFVHTDHLGTPVAYSNALGQVIGEESTTPFGESLNTPTSNDLPAFTGHVRDGSTGLVYMQARYYDPVVGRFLSPDPVGVKGRYSTEGILDDGVERYKHFNRYWYANGNPLTHTDPDGEIAIVIPVIAGAILIAGASQTPAGKAAIKQTADFLAGGAELGVSLVSEAVGVFSKAGSADSGTSPEIDPGEIAGKSPEEIDEIAKEKGLDAKGPDPAGGKGAYVDPETGEQRILVHPDAESGPHAHVNDSEGNRLNAKGEKVENESPDAHLPLKDQ